MLRLTRQDDGATTIMIAVSMAVVFGFLAVSVDVGHLYAERRELQNGADAAVLAVAADCADDDDCMTLVNSATVVDPYATADAYADDNAEDGAAVIANPTGLTFTPPAPATNQPGKVSARATTEDEAGRGFIVNWFAGVLGMLIGDGSIATSEVEAKAAAIWGPIAFGSMPAELPLTFSQCEYELFLASGGGHATEPWTQAHNGPPSVIYFHSGARNQPTPDCPADPVHDTDGDGRLAGGFGWLDTSGGCSADVDGEGWVGEDPGAAPDQTVCDPAWVRDNLLEEIIVIPVFEDINGLGGNNGQYRVSTYAAFYVTGYNFGGQYKAPTSADAPCAGELRCIAGWFTNAVVDGGVIDPGGSGDVRAVQLVLE